MKIDITFNVYTHANGGDPDSTSPTLRSYQKMLCSKKLPNRELFELTDKKGGTYLYNKSGLGDFYLGSDAITHSNRNHKRKIWITEQIKNEVMNFKKARNKRIEEYAKWTTEPLSITKKRF